MSRRQRYTRNLGRALREPTPVQATRAWIRYEHAHEPYGVFSFVNAACSRLDPKRRAQLEALNQWFHDHLFAPSAYLDEARFWFRAEAGGYAARARQMAALITQAGIPIVERRIARLPGHVRWQDPHQAAVLTYRDTPQPARGQP
jgi:hypothetical protein